MINCCHSIKSQLLHLCTKGRLFSPTKGFCFAFILSLLHHQLSPLYQNIFVSRLTCSNIYQNIKVKFPLDLIFTSSFCLISLLLLSTNHLKRVIYICCLKLIICHFLFNLFQSKFYPDHFRKTTLVEITMISTLLNPILKSLHLSYSISQQYLTQQKYYFQLAPMIPDSPSFLLTSVAAPSP